MADVLLVAATEIELCEHARPGLRRRPGRGGRRDRAASWRPSALRGRARRDRRRTRHHARGSRDRAASPLYVDLSAEIPVVDRVEPDPELLEKVRAAASRRSRAAHRNERGGRWSRRRRPARRGDGGIRRPARMRARGRARPSRSARSRTSLPRATARAGASVARSRPSRTCSPTCSKRQRSSLLARWRREQKREERPLPPPLPPAQRTVGQLVGEAIRAYGARFWQGLVARHSRSSSRTPSSGSDRPTICGLVLLPADRAC